MKKHNRALRFFGFNLRFLIVLILISVLSMGCGGSGDDGGGSDDGLSYSGVTTPAVIDESNAHNMTMEPFTNTEIGISAISFFVTTMESFLREIGSTSRTGVTNVTVSYHESDTIYGDCGGSTLVDISLNDQTGEFSGSFSYNDYCTDEVILSGTATFLGQKDLSDGEVTRFSLFLKNLTIISASDSFTLNGDISLDSSGPQTLTMDVLIEDSRTDAVCWCKDYTLTLTERWDSREFEVSGIFYNSDYGYIVVSTKEPFVVYDWDHWQSEGVLVVTGDTGIAGGSTKARLTVLSSMTYEVGADTDGDGVYDWESGVLYWSDL